MLLKGHLSVHQRDDQYIAILVDYPYWMIVNEAGKEVLELCYQCSAMGEVVTRFSESSQMPIRESTNLIEEFLTPLNDHRILGLDPDISGHSVDPILIAICINITRDCNLFCPHCYASGGTIYPDELSTEEIRAFLQEAKPYTKGPVQVQLTGGEPFLQEEKLFAAIDESHNLGYNTLIVNTNGLLLTRKKVERLKNAISGFEFFNITVSLDGATRKTHEQIRGPDTFERTLHALRMLREAGLPVAASITVHQGNFTELEAIFNLCMNLGVTPYTSPLAPLGRAPHSGLSPVKLSDLVIETYRIIKKNDFPRERMGATFLYSIVQTLRNMSKRLYCGSGLSTLFLDSNGDLYPCMNTLYQAAFKCGNIRTASFGDLWEHSPVYSNLRALVIPESNDTCSQCDLKYFCGGYCRGLTYALTGDLHAPFSWCEDFKKTLLEALWILAEEPDLFKEQARNEFRRYGIW